MKRQYLHQLVDEQVALNAFFHGSPVPLPVGATLKAKKNAQRARALVERSIDKRRPVGVSPRWQSWYMVQDPCDVATAGGATQYIYEVLPSQRPHAANYTAFEKGVKRFLQQAARDGLTPSQTEVDNLVGSLARDYWNNRPTKNRKTEWLAPKIQVVQRATCRPSKKKKRARK